MKRVLSSVFATDTINIVFTPWNVALAFILAVPIAMWWSSRWVLPPGPLNIPFFREFQISSLDGKSFNRILFEFGKKYGPIFRLNLGSCYLTIVQGHDLIQEVFENSSENFKERPTWLYSVKNIYEGKGNSSFYVFYYLTFVVDIKADCKLKSCVHGWRFRMHQRLKTIYG